MCWQYVGAYRWVMAPGYWAAVELGVFYGQPDLYRATVAHLAAYYTDSLADAKAWCEEAVAEKVRYNMIMGTLGDE